MKAFQQQRILLFAAVLLSFSGCFGSQSENSEDYWNWEGEANTAHSVSNTLDSEQSANTEDDFSPRQEKHLQIEGEKETGDIATELNNMWGPDPFSQEKPEENGTDEQVAPSEVMQKNQDNVDTWFPEEEPETVLKQEPKKSSSVPVSSQQDMLDILRKIAEVEIESEKREVLLHALESVPNTSDSIDFLLELKRVLPSSLHDIVNTKIVTLLEKQE